MKKIVALVLAMMMIAMTACAFAATGCGAVTSVSCTNAEGETAGKVSITTTMCAVTLDENGVITGIQFNAVQPSATYDAQGVAGNYNAAPITKFEKQDAYGMRGASAIGAEWFEQAAAFEAWCVGKTVEQVLGMQTYVKNEEHNCVPNEPDLLTSCTIDVGSFLAALKLAAAQAK